LSGGLDSSAVVSIAARCLEKQNRQLTAVAAILPDESRAEFSDEREYIDEFRSYPNVHIEYVTAQGRGPFDSLSDPSRFFVGPARTSRFFLNEECEKAAIGRGARSLFWGVRGGGPFSLAHPRPSVKDSPGLPELIFDSPTRGAVPEYCLPSAGAKAFHFAGARFPAGLQSKTGLDKPFALPTVLSSGADQILAQQACHGTGPSNLAPPPHHSASG
jgi:hypothetical protein